MFPQFDDSGLDMGEEIPGGGEKVIRLGKEPPNINNVEQGQHTTDE